MGFPFKNQETSVAKAESVILRAYCLNALRSPIGLHLLQTIERSLQRIDPEFDWGEHDISSPRLDDDPGLKQRKLRLRALVKRLSATDQTTDAPETCELNTGFASSIFGLDAMEASILRLVVRLKRYTMLAIIANDLFDRMNSASEGLAALLGLDAAEVLRRLAPGATLVRSGLILTNRSARKLGGEYGFFSVTTGVYQAMYRPYPGAEAWLDALLGKRGVASLPASAFQHIRTDFERLAALLAASADGGAPGINILLHGKPGSGKTELALAAAEAAGVPIWSIGEADEDGDDIGRQERLAALRIALACSGHSAGSVLLVDEADDVLLSGSLYRERASAGSKIFLNRLLEAARAPVIWIVNDIGGLEASVIRRMSLVLELMPPGPATREDIWREHRARTEVGVSDTFVRRMSQKWETPPSVISAALRTAALIAPTNPEGEVEQMISGMMSALGVEGQQAPLCETFDPSLIACDNDLGELADSLTRPGANPAWSLCLHGPPGTGKSQYARYLAARSGRQLVEVRASDVLSKWVGETEANIAAIFRKARNDHACLVFDEADSLLRDRAGASHRWEASQVNEMLNSIEGHPGPVICSTNDVDSLDPAALRRFTFRLGFRTISEDQARRLYAAYLGTPPNRRLPEGLAPADFSVIAKRCAFLGTCSEAQIIAWLEAEAAARGHRSSMGFRIAQGGRA
jgi:transitional endoplasmic reticulum ATPase